MILVHVQLSLLRIPECFYLIHFILVYIYFLTQIRHVHSLSFPLCHVRAISILYTLPLLYFYPILTS